MATLTEQELKVIIARMQKMPYEQVADIVALLLGKLQEVEAAGQANGVSAVAESASAAH